MLKSSIISSCALKPISASELSLALWVFVFGPLTDDMSIVDVPILQISLTEQFPQLSLRWLNIVYSYLSHGLNISYQHVVAAFHPLITLLSSSLLQLITLSFPSLLSCFFLAPPSLLPRLFEHSSLPIVRHFRKISYDRVGGVKGEAKEKRWWYKEEMKMVRREGEGSIKEWRRWHKEATKMAQMKSECNTKDRRK